ncbi:MAG TPA: hypothetical protein VFT59_03540 [Candidatus Saccharimonadales bacterium]|nr:hypothetical protein [Candidatus Saccharimonadales bacterium]
MSERVMVFVDGPNADNQACAWGAFNGFNTEHTELAGVVISATAVNTAENAPLGSRNVEESRAVHRLHTARMAGLFSRAGLDVPVFSGLDIEDTAITSPIPHRAHVNHEDYDIYGDATGEGRAAIAGDFHDALRHMDSLDGRLHIVVGGPFSEIPELLRRPTVYHKLGHLAAQAGFSMSERAIYSKLAFNVDVDMFAALQTFIQYPGLMINVPSDITRHPSVTFQSAEELLRHGVHPEIGEIFVRHRARAEERHKEEQRQREAEGKPFKPYPALSIHDLQAVFALRQTMGLEQNMYQWEEINPDEAIANLETAASLRAIDTYSPPITRDVVRSLGYIGAGVITNGAEQWRLPSRYVVTAQNSELYKQRAPQLLAPIGSIS